MSKATFDPLAPVAVTLATGAKHATGQRQFQGIPGIAVAPSGRLWATWYSGGVVWRFWYM